MLNLTCLNCNLVISIQFFLFFPPIQSNLHCLHSDCLAFPSCFGSVEPRRRRLSQALHWNQAQFSPKRTVTPISDFLFWKQGYWFGWRQQNSLSHPEIAARLSSQQWNRGEVPQNQEYFCFWRLGTDREAKPQRKKDASFLKQSLWIKKFKVIFIHVLARLSKCERDAGIFEQAESISSLVTLCDLSWSVPLGAICSLSCP